MTKNLEKADVIVKLVLSATVLTLYVCRVITGPWAHAMAVLSGGIILIFCLRLLVKGKNS